MISEVAVEMHGSRWAKYSVYRDSGVEWLGEVPDGWMIKRVGIDTKSLTGFAFESEKFSYDDEHVKLVRGDNVTTGKLRWGDKTRRWSEISHDLERHLLEENDIVIGMDGSKVGKNYAIVKEGDLPLILVQRVARIRCLHSLIPRFLYYFIANDFFSYYVNLTKTDPAVPHITLKNIRDYPICFPSLPEQRAIATFLDRETGRIDTLIEKKERQIELLQEKRAALISHTVTKGLDPDVKMKDSGVEWLGAVPEHWNIERLKYCAPLINEKVDGRESILPYTGLENIESWTGRLISREEVATSEGQSSRFEIGDVLFGKLRPYLAKVLRAKEHGICTGELLVLRPKDVSQDYLFRCMLTRDFISIVDSSTYGAKMPRASWDFIGDLSVLLPTEVEQRAIAAFLDRETGRIDTLTTKIHESISKLREYRTALISAAVTGKIDVRGELVS